MKHFDPSEKEGRKAALSKLQSLLSSHNGKKLAGLKKPVGVPAEGLLAEEAAETPEQETAEGGFCQHCGKPR